jgi:beta-galactosidase
MKITLTAPLAVTALCLFCSAAAAQIYTPPPSLRVDNILDTGWTFTTNTVSGAQATNYNDSSWTTVNLPHTWDIPDGQSYPPSAYYSGIGWYRTHYTVGNSFAGLHFFLKFDGAFSDANVWINGNYLGEHQGGFAAFVFDVTPYVNVGADNVIAVELNNAFNASLPPLEADFTFWGGLYRDVHLLVTDPVQISPLDYGSPGVFLTTTSVSSNSANLQVTTVVSNSTGSAQTVTVRAVVTDAATNIVTALSNVVTLPASSLSNVVAGTVIANPHLWNGRADPYLYQTFVEVWSGTNVVDLVAQPLGFRSFYVDPTNGFFLNGSHYDLHGVNMHQDWLNCGWALTNAQRDTNFGFIKKIGATIIRLSHYEHNDYTYQLADQNGICVWSEVPIIDYITASTAFTSNTLQQLREMIRQRYNHPSVICWSVYNEITLVSGPSPTNLIAQEVQLVAQEDSTRPSTAAANTSISDPSTFYTQLIAFNEYFGWYSSPLNGIAAWADNVHATYPTRCVGVTEYGAGASIYQHSENPTFPANTATGFHPEEWQNIVHETNWQLMAARPFLWCKMVWNEFDFASDSRDEGDTPGRNDKGLATYDRRVSKDAFYYYQANWTTNPMVYITGHTFTNRLTNIITAKVYANCDSVQLFFNGNSQGVVTSTNCIYLWPLTLLPGTNQVSVIGVKGGSNVTDSLIWVAPIPPPVVSVITPVGAIAYLNSTNDTLLLSVNVSNPAPANALTTAWSAFSGPGAINLSGSNALTTAVNFTSNGIYSLGFTANNGAAVTVPFTVTVGSGGAVTNGLLAWWKMNQTSGNTAADSSGNGRAATASGAYFTNYATGFPSNALHFNGSSSYASFSSPAVTQLTLAAWARASAQGNSDYPRIFDTPGYRMFFRFDSQGDNGFDFATYSSDNGDWFSGANTISLGAWYHVAASYDLSNLTNVPAEYVNGVPMAAPLTVIMTPSGAQPSSTGTGYIGNVAALTRGWSGDLSDLRIYNRILSGPEVQILANAASVNYAPSVHAGGNQSIIWPSAASLSGTVADNGNPSSAVTTAWSEVSGPGAVTFGNAGVLATTANFSAPGTYQLQLAAGNGQAATVASLTVTAVQPVISISRLSNAVQLSWPANAGNWMLQYQSNPPAIGLGTNWLLIPGLVTNPFLVPVYSNTGPAFYRLQLTN